MVLSDKREHLKNRISLMEKKYLKLGEIDNEISVDDVSRIKMMIEVEENSFFDENETDPYKFGLEIKESLESQNLKVKGYKTIELDEVLFIEFSVSGSSLDFFMFLKNLNTRGKNYNFPYFTIRNENNGISSTFRIGYMLNE
jgi:hypothetical protein